MQILTQDKSYILRKYITTDAQQIYEAVMESLPQLSPWLTWACPEYSMAHTRAFLESRETAWNEDKEYDFAIIDRESGGFVGGIGINMINRFFQMANLGYWVRTSWTKKGAASICARQIAEYGIKKLGFQRIEVLVDIENIPSQRVAEKMGAYREGLMRNRLKPRGVPRDAYMYSIIHQDLHND